MTFKELSDKLSKDKKCRKSPLIVEIYDAQFYIKDFAYNNQDKIMYLFIDLDYHCFSPNNFISEFHKNNYKSFYNVKVISEEFNLISTVSYVRIEYGDSNFGEYDKEILVCR